MRQVWPSIPDGAPKRFVIAVVVIRTIVALINQEDPVLGGRPLDFARLLSSYLLYRCVSTYGALTGRRDAAGRVRR